MPRSDTTFKEGNKAAVGRSARQFSWKNLLNKYDEKSQQDYIDLIYQSAMDGNPDAQKLWADKILPKLMNNAPDIDPTIIEKLETTDGIHECLIEILKNYFRKETESIVVKEARGMTTIFSYT